MKRDRNELINRGDNAGQCSEYHTSTNGPVNIAPQKRARLQDSADLICRLASITLTQDHLRQLDTLFADPEQLEQFSTAVSGCLVRIDRQATGQKNDVIAQITGLVMPRQTQRISLPNRRIFVINLGYFEFDQIAQQMPDQTDYGDWIVDMEMESLPLPSDEFLREKALYLVDLLSQANTNVAGKSRFAGARATNVEEEEEEGEEEDEEEGEEEEAEGEQEEEEEEEEEGELMGGREEEQSGGGQDEEEAVAAEDEPANRDSTASQMLATSAAMKEEGEADLSDTEYELDDEDEEEADDAEAEVAIQSFETGQECSAADSEELASMAGLVASSEQLRAVRVPLFMVRLLAQHNAVDCLRGCLVVCHVNGRNKAITDEIDQVIPAAGEIRFKHSRKSYLLKHLKNIDTPNNKLFNQWIEKIANWGESLPPLTVHIRRMENVYENIKQITTEHLAQNPSRFGKIEQRMRKENNSLSKLIKQMEVRRADGTAEQNLRRTHQRLLLSANGDSVLSSSSDDDEEVDEATGELPMDKLVHTKELLEEACLSYALVQNVAKYIELIISLPGCLVKCRTRDTNEATIDVIAEINQLGIKFKHSEQPFLLEELCMMDERISTEVFTKWIEDMTRWDEPLPPIRVCEQHKKRVLRALAKAKQSDPEQQRLSQARRESELAKQQAWKPALKNGHQKFDEFFGQDTRQIVVNPQHLVRLHQLDEVEFARTVTGLFVRYSIDNCKTISLEQIRMVSTGHLPAYTIFGHRLTVRLHFKRPEAASAPILNVQFDNKCGDHQLVEQHAKMIGSFVPPSPEFIRMKKEQLRCALSKTPEIVGKANPAWANN